MNLLWVILIGLAIGSFLNVVIYRLPKMLQQQWHDDCAVLLSQSILPKKSLNLCFPSSHCPYCLNHLKWWHNIPLLSFILLKKRCAFCQKTIAWRYPLVELLTAIILVFLFYRFHGFTLAFFSGAVFSLLLIPLIMIDVDHQLLPDELTLTLLWVGLLASLDHIFITPNQAIIGAISGYLALAIIGLSYQKIAGRVGLGGGDVKLFAAMGAWVGWQLLPIVILLACIGGLLISGILIWRRGDSRYTRFAFGPYLAIAGWGVWLWQVPIMRLL